MGSASQGSKSTMPPARTSGLMNTGSTTRTCDEEALPAVCVVLALVLGLPPPGCLWLSSAAENDRVLFDLRLRDGGAGV